MKLRCDPALKAGSCDRLRARVHSHCVRRGVGHPALGCKGNRLCAQPPKASFGLGRDLKGRLLQAGVFDAAQGDHRLVEGHGHGPDQLDRAFGADVQDFDWALFDLGAFVAGQSNLGWEGQADVGADLPRRLGARSEAKEDLFARRFHRWEASKGIRGLLGLLGLFCGFLRCLFAGHWRRSVASGEADGGATKSCNAPVPKLACSTHGYSFVVVFLANPVIYASRDGTFYS